MIRFFVQVLKVCDASSLGCRAECTEAVLDAKRNNKCFRNSWDYMAHIYNDSNDATLMKFAAVMNSCGPQG